MTENQNPSEVLALHQVVILHSQVLPSKLQSSNPASLSEYTHIIRRKNI